MSSMKTHWPVLLMGLVWIGCVVLYRVAYARDRDLLDISIMAFLILMLFILVLSLWYGYRLPGVRKLWIVPGCGILALLNNSVGAGGWDIWNYWELGAAAAILALMGLLAGTGLRRLRDRRR